MDIVLKGKKLKQNNISHISYLLNEETIMPYKFDVLNYATISNKYLVNNIDRVGKIIYSK